MMLILRIAQMLMVKLRRSTPQQKEKFERCCEVEKCEKLQLIRDVRVRWNSTYYMLVRAERLKAAYTSMCNSDSFLTPYKLDDYEWIYLSKVMSLLRSFDQASKHLSSSVSYPSINKTIVFYNKLIDAIEDFMEDPDLDDQLYRAAYLGREKLKKYYIKTDYTHIYSVVTALDPRMKYRWWEICKWPSDMRNVCQQHVKDTWENDYKREGEPLTVQQSEELRQQYELYGALDSIDELEDYLSEVSAPCIGIKAPELLYWKTHAKKWPNLARMARDYLAIPVTSTPVERCFSAARQVLPYTRNRLSTHSIKMLMLLDSWSEYVDNLGDLDALVEERAEESEGTASEDDD